MSVYIKKVAVIGAGVMGAGIAAHIAGAGIPVVLLDIVPPHLTDDDKRQGLTEENIKFRNKFAETGKLKVCDPKARLAFSGETADLIETGNLSDDLEKLRTCDWIIEVVVERLDIKEKMFNDIESYIHDKAILSTNTSGISIDEISKSIPERLRGRFMGTHFFNPTRYMKLFEIIPGKETLPENIEIMKAFASRRLGKGVVEAKDTPNFIANRIGAHAAISAMQLTEKYGFSIQKSDAILGNIVARPKTATFKTADLVGLDIGGHVARNVIEHSVDEAERNAYTLPAYATRIIERGYLGNKTGSGYYKKVRTAEGDQRFYWDYFKEEYVPLEILKSDAVNEAMKEKTTQKRLKTMVWGDCEENNFAWEAVKANLLYTAAKAPEIADDYKEIDNAMRWGYNWELGPFEIWDAIGVPESVDRMVKEGHVVPVWIKERLAEGRNTFYDEKSAEAPYIILTSDVYPIIRENSDAVLKNLGDGVACLEFRTKGNTVTGDIANMLMDSIKIVEEGDYKGLVLANQGKNFSAGANLAYIMEMIRSGQWDNIEYAIHTFQHTNMSMKRCSKPIVSAPHGMTLGGGAEMSLHTAAQIAHAETYMGLVELGVGLVPGGGGCKELLVRMMEKSGDKTALNLTLATQHAMEAIAMAKVSTSGHNAAEIGFLGKKDRVCMSLDYLIDEAKQTVINLYDQGFRPNYKEEVVVGGTTTKAALQTGLYGMEKGRFISTYDAFLANKVVHILSGGDVITGTKVSEEWILELEKEAFLSLCGEAKTQERIGYMLKNGKPLRN
ncbi:MAG: 3-hydroxyacyl-CoA dehydrogenase [Firmicutes bacterium]|nr:3-hydroxyacyl-CoA dehydrogenase [Bacillota bacterium]